MDALPKQMGQTREGVDHPNGRSQGMDSEKMHSLVSYISHPHFSLGLCNALVKVSQKFHNTKFYNKRSVSWNTTRIPSSFLGFGECIAIIIKLNELSSHLMSLGKSRTLPKYSTYSHGGWNPLSFSHLGYFHPLPSHFLQLLSSCHTAWAVLFYSSK